MDFNADPNPNPYFDFDADPDPVFDFDADPDTTSQNDADPQHCLLQYENNLMSVDIIVILIPPNIARTQYL